MNASKKGTRGTASALVIGNPNDPYSLYHAMGRFLQHQAERNYSPRTIGNQSVNLRSFIQWADERGLHRPTEITRPILESYQRHLYQRRKKNGEPLSVMNQNGHVVAIKVWFRWLVRNNHLLYNAASDLEMLRGERRLPKFILTASEVETILNLADIGTARGLRDRAILETLYSTGMRRLELIGLQWTAIDYDRGTVLIRQGKGRKDRMVPIGERALSWIYKYQYDARPALTIGQDDGSLFVNYLGRAFSPDGLTGLVRKYILDADIGKRGSCHLFRHTCATLMLENGADIRFIQALLGHAQLDTTAIYTQVSIRQLKAIHTLTHPAKAEREAEDGERPESDVES